MLHAANRFLSHSFPPDLSHHILGVPKSRPRFDWILIAIAAGALLAFVVSTSGNLIFW